MQQRSEEWFATRAGRFTGSRFSDLMARTKSGPSTSRANLLAALAVERITGQCVETFANAAMQRGTEMEPDARAAYEVHSGEMVIEVAWVPHPTLPFCGVSPDGFVGERGMVEFKVPAAMAKHLAALRSGDHTTEYKWQLQGQLWVCEREWVDVASYDPRWPVGLDLAVTRVYRDEPAIVALEMECKAAEEEVCALVRELENRRAAA